MDASPYLILADWKGFCPLEDNGWMMRPSTAAKIKTLRARPGMVLCGVCGPVLLAQEMAKIAAKDRNQGNVMSRGS